MDLLLELLLELLVELLYTSLGFMGIICLLLFSPCYRHELGTTHAVPSVSLSGFYSYNIEIMMINRQLINIIGK